MAEIKIEKKKPVWPWILALLAIAAIIYFVFFRDSNPETVVRDETENVVGSTGDADQGSNSDIAAYVDFINSYDQNMGLDHEFTNEAFSKLIAATQAKAADLEYDVEGDMSAVREHARHITDDPYETSHANSISKAAAIIADALEGMQEREYPELADRAAKVQSSADAIDPDKLTLDQKEAVKSFFDNAAGLLENMNK